MPKKQVIVDFSEIFEFAEKKFGICWNICCDIFHGRDEILCSPENNNKTIYLQDKEAELKYDEEHPEAKYKLSAKKKQGFEVLVAYMKKHKLKEMLVLND